MVQLTGMEREVYFLKVVQELIDSFINHEVLEIEPVNTGESNEKAKTAYARFQSRVAGKLFNIHLADFLSESDDKAAGEKILYLDVLQGICKNPYFNVRDSVADLTNSVSVLKYVLEREVVFERLWLPNIELQIDLKIKRKDHIKICGNISKHNISRLGGVADTLRKVFRRNGVELSREQASKVIEDFYENFHDDVLYREACPLVAYFNDVRWGIHSYLRPELHRSYRMDYVNPVNPIMYRFVCPDEIQTKRIQTMHWDLMNAVSSPPRIERFKPWYPLKDKY